MSKFEKVKEFGRKIAKGLKELDQALDRLGFKARIRPIDIVTGRAKTPFQTSAVPPITLSEETLEYLKANGFKATAKLIAGKLNLTEAQIAEVEERLKILMSRMWGKVW